LRLLLSQHLQQPVQCRCTEARSDFDPALSHASFRELRQFLPRRQAETVMAALSVANVAEAEHALSARLNNPEAIYKANLDMKGFHQEVVRVVLLDSQLRCITKVDIAKGTADWLLH
jgi:DNA repair protein RadC